jgi:hypothetical protein
LCGAVIDCGTMGSHVAKEHIPRYCGSRRAAYFTVGMPIRQGFRDAFKIGLHDYSARRVLSRSEGSFVFNAGEWQAKVRD